MMLCEICKKNPATVHVQEIINGEKHVMHFCPECAEKKSMLEPFLKGMTLAGLLQQLENMDGGGEHDKGQSSPAGKRENARPLVCAECGWTLDRLKKTGRLGCAECYSVFLPVLEAELAGVHRGLVSNGMLPPSNGIKEKTVCSAPSGIHAARELETLQKKLDECIRREEFELAAELRDRIAALKRILSEKENAQ